MRKHTDKELENTVTQIKKAYLEDFGSPLQVDVAKGLLAEARLSRTKKFLDNKTSHYLNEDFSRLLSLFSEEKSEEKPKEEIKVTEVKPSLLLSGTVEIDKSAIEASLSVEKKKYGKANKSR